MSDPGRPSESEGDEWLDMSCYDMKVTRLRTSKSEYVFVSNVVPEHQQKLLAAGASAVRSRPDLCFFEGQDRTARSKALSDLRQAFPLSRTVSYDPETHSKDAAAIRGKPPHGVLQHPSTLGSRRSIEVDDVVWSGEMGFEPRGRHATIDPSFPDVCIDRVNGGYRLSVADPWNDRAYEEVTVADTIEGAIATLQWVSEAEGAVRFRRDAIDRRRASAPDDADGLKTIVLGFRGGRMEFRRKRGEAGWRIPATTIQDVLPKEFPDVATLLSAFQMRKHDLSLMVRRMSDEEFARRMKEREERMRRQGEAAPWFAAGP